MKKAIVLHSGGLDSKLATQLLQNQNFNTTTLHFNLPFSHDDETTQSKTIDITKEPLLSEYLKIIKNPKFETGSGINPCKDCKIFMFKKAKEYADKHNINIIATGEVIGQRPLSQNPSAIKTIDKEIDFEILRPLCAKHLPETTAEKTGKIDRNKLLDIHNRGRKEQITLAEKYNIKYPTPAGGCLLCEKEMAPRLKQLLKNNLITEKTLSLTKIGRHFFINKTWFVVARDAKESKIISKFPNHIKDDYRKPAVYFHQIPNPKSQIPSEATELQEAYSTGDNKEKRNKFSKYKI